jgi:hypothetical protein
MDSNNMQYGGGDMYSGGGSDTSDNTRSNGPVSAWESATSNSGDGGSVYVPYTGPVEEDKKGKAGLVVGIILAVILLLGCGAFAAYKLVFDKPMNKVALATQATIKEDGLLNTLSAVASVSKNDEITEEFVIKYTASGVSADITGSVAVDMSEGLMGGEAVVTGLGTEQNVSYYMNDRKMQFYAPGLIDKRFEYDFTKNNTGYLNNLLYSTNGSSTADLNEALSAFVELEKKTGELRDSRSASFTEALNALDCRKADPREMEIDGQTVKADGYEIIITPESATKLGEAFSFDGEDEDLKAIYEKYLGALGRLGGEDASDILAESENAFEDLADSSFYVYLYKGKLACVYIPGTDGGMVLELNGGDKRTSNMVMTVNESGESFNITKTSSMSDNTEIGSYIIDGQTYVYTYDATTGDGSVDLGSGVVKFNIKPQNGNEVIFGFNYSGDDSVMDVSFKMKPGADIKEITSGTVFDLGNASESDYEALIKSAVFGM